MAETLQTFALPQIGFLRLWHIIGDPKAKPPIPPIVPVSNSTIWAWVKEGRFPAPVKIGPRTTAWDVRDVRRWLDECSEIGDS